MTGRIRALVLVLGAVVAACGSGLPAPATTPDRSDASGSRGPATPRPAPGHELYGYLPYWEMEDGIAAHLADTPLTTLALFSVTNASDGSLDASQPGYRRVTGDLGRGLIAAARDRGVRTELVFTSFGLDRNRRLLERPGLQEAVVSSLVALGTELGTDGINVDIEGLDPFLVPAFGGFVERLRTAVVAADPADQVSAATSANPLGAAMAAAASAAGADRIFLMGYDYRVARSEPGASAPLDREDGSPQTLRWSLDLYETLGVPVDRTLLGLPLYGMTWPVAGPVVGAPRVGRGDAWIPRRNLDLLEDPRAIPVRDDLEGVDVYFVGSDGSLAPPPPDATPPPEGTPDVDWTAVYVDAPDTLARKLALANERGLAGGGFWAIGYERGQPAFTELMGRFTAGEPLE